MISLFISLILPLILSVSVLFMISCSAAVFILVVIVSEEWRTFVHSYKMRAAPVMMMTKTSRQPACIHPSAAFGVHVHLPVYVVINAIVRQVIIIGYFRINGLPVLRPANVHIHIDLCQRRRAES